MFFHFHPYLPGEDEPNLTVAYFFKWVETSTTTEASRITTELVTKHLRAAADSAVRQVAGHLLVSVFVCGMEKSKTKSDHVLK